MVEPLFSPSWYRVADLKPRLRSHAQIHRHQYRGQTWYVLQDLTSERFHRFSPAAYFIIGLMDGKRTVQQIWDAALARLGDDAVSQDQVIQLLGQLHVADVLQCDVPPDTAELFRRRQRQDQSRLRRKLLSIFAWQIRVFDPERLLRRWMPLVKPLFGWTGVALWSAAVGTGCVLGWAHWPELSHNLLDQVLLPQNLLLMWLLFPAIKLVHEFGHAFAVKVYGGEVHEMGIMILVLTPVPYVDASSAWAFASKGQRVLVGAAGMGAELFIAALALFLWINLEPGIARALCYNTVLIASISTVLFNANPLLRFDGYYMLMDWLEIPNLRSRATAYLAHLAERYLFGRREAESPAATRGEKTWFVVFSLASFAYRILVIVAILFFLGRQHLLLGLVFAGLTALAWLVIPAVKIALYLGVSPRIHRVRLRAHIATLGVVGGLLLLVGGLPVPFRTVSEGVVWVPEEGLVRAGTDGFISRVVARPGTWVKEGELLIGCEDRDLVTEVEVLDARLRELDARYRPLAYADRVRAQIIDEQRHVVAEDLSRARERLSELSIFSHAPGLFVLPQAQDLPGRYARRGQMLAHVVAVGTITVRTVVTQQDFDLVRERSVGVDVRLAERLGETVRGSIRRVVPAASDQLPSPALGSQGGGSLPLDPSDREGHRAVQRFFQVDVELPSGGRAIHVGEHVWVRFHYGWQPLAYQWYRSARQMFLSRLNV